MSIAPSRTLSETIWAAMAVVYAAAISALAFEAAGAPAAAIMAVSVFGTVFSLRRWSR